MGDIHNTEIERVAASLKICLDKETKASIAVQIVDTLHMCETMLEVDTENVPPMTSPAEGDQFLREDIIQNTTTKEQLQDCSSHIEDGKYTVPSAVE